MGVKEACRWSAPLEIIEIKGVSDVLACFFVVLKKVKTWVIDMLMFRRGPAIKDLVRSRGTWCARNSVKNSKSIYKVGIYPNFFKPVPVSMTFST